MPKPLLVDAHQDLAWNILTFGRDYTRTVAETRALEHGGVAPRVNGDTLLGRDAYMQGRVAVVFATLYASPIRHRIGAWDTIFYRDDEEAHHVYRRQVDTYCQLAEDHPGHFTRLQTRPQLQAHLTAWHAAGEVPDLPVGLLTLMEGAEAVRSPGELEDWWALGVRVVGPAWAGNRYCGGTAEPGPLTDEGRVLLAHMAELGFVLDISHMDEPAALDALDTYEGTIIASHANAKALLPGTQSNRHLSDNVLARLLERGGIVGAVPYNTFLKVGWKMGDPREQVALDAVAAHIDYVCQMAGNARHSGIGSDADGGFGLQSAPEGINTLADLHGLADLLAGRGYTLDDIAAILGGNWLRLLESALPETA
ncbi:MAG: membrane dipeptidase [Chloroflexi bacterium]|nr:membrane dipeptidase [Chloroflexota bacterium]